VPRTPTPKAEGITIGFLGTGVKKVDPATDLIEQYINDHVKPDEPARFIFPLTNEEFSDSMADLARMARKSSITYEVISLTGDRNRKLFTEVASAAAKQYFVTDVWHQMELTLTEAPQAALFVIWDEQREEELSDIASGFMDASIPVLDLTNNLIPLTKDEEPDDETPDETEEAAQGEEETEDEGDDEAEAVRELEAEATTEQDRDGQEYTRPELEKMSHAEVKDIAVGMGLAPRKARENMIVAILERQGTPSEAPVGPQAGTAAPVDTGAATEFLEGLKDILDEFGSRFMGGLDDWLTKFSTAAEGFAFNTAPEEPMEVEPEPEPERPQPGRRRLVRS
jgi:hypothetical protein